MTEAESLERLRLRLPEADDMRLTALLQDAEGMILAYTGRSALPACLDTAQVLLAAALANRLGIEGENAHSEGGVSRTMEGLPDEIRRQIAPYRLARVVNTRETEGA